MKSGVAESTVLESFIRRAERAELLLGDASRAKSELSEVLATAAAVYRAQAEIALALERAHRERPFSGRMNEDGPRLDERARGLLRLVAKSGPPKLAKDAADRASEPAEARSARLVAYWEAEGAAIEREAGGQPGLRDSGGGSDAPGSDAPGSDAPGSGAPGSDAPGSDAPGSDAPGSGAPGSGRAGAESGIAGGVDFLSRAIVRPYAELLRASGIPPVRPRFDGGCPFCGGRPWIAWRRSTSDADGAGRFVGCAVCGHEWQVRRIQCGACGEEDPTKLPSFQSDAYPSVRIEACETCKGYLKSIDLTLDARPIPEVDDLLSISMDLWAIDQGLRRIEPGLAGV